MTFTPALLVRVTFTKMVFQHGVFTFTELWLLGTLYNTAYMFKFQQNFFKLLLNCAHWCFCCAMQFFSKQWVTLFQGILQSVHFYFVWYRFPLSKSAKMKVNIKNLKRWWRVIRDATFEAGWWARTTVKTLMCFHIWQNIDWPQHDTLKPTFI